MADTKIAASVPHQPVDKEFWASTWAKDNTFWQVADVHPTLIKYLPRLVGVDAGAGSPPTLEEVQAIARDKKIFVPLCGKTRDIGYLLRLGFRVFAIEYVKKAIEELDEENGFGLRLQQDALESVYLSADGRLTIYNGDMLECPIEKWGPFDCVWDRASFIAVDYSQRAKYADVVRRSVAGADGEFRYLLETFNCERALFAGPPHAVSMDDIQEYFGPWAKHEPLEVMPLHEQHLMRQAMKGTPAECMASLFTLK